MIKADENERVFVFYSERADTMVGVESIIMYNLALATSTYSNKKIIIIKINSQQTSRKLEYINHGVVGREGCFCNAFCSILKEKKEKYIL